MKDTMKIAFTGTQCGMSEDQAIKLMSILKDLEPSELHHGDCVGADAQANIIALSLGIPIILHPPTNSTNRAYCYGASESRPPKPYLERNWDMVTECDTVVATPAGPVEMRRSGTWATVRYGRKLSREVIIITP